MYLSLMKSEYFVLLPDDICCSLQNFSAITTEQIFNLRILCERYLQHQQDLYHVFIDFKKAFDRVWKKALWSTMRLYNISANLIQVIENLYNKATRHL